MAKTSPDEHRSQVAEAWRIAMAHLHLGEVPIEELDLGDPKGAAPKDPKPPTEREIDDSVDESFPASDPPSWTKTHA
jgi:hypothetical protein